MGLGFSVWGFGFRVQILRFGFGVWSLGFRGAVAKSLHQHIDLCIVCLHIHTRVYLDMCICACVKICVCVFTHRCMLNICIDMYIYTRKFLPIVVATAVLLCHYHGQCYY